MQNIKSLRQKTIILLLGSFIILMLSCTTHKTEPWLNKTIRFPDCLEKYNNISYPAPDYRLLVIFNGGCSLCIASLNEWSRILRNNLSEFNIEPVFVAVDSDKEVLMFNLDNMKFQFNVLIDNDSTFYETNHLKLNDNEYYLLSEENKILMKGNSRPEVTLRKYLIEP